MSENKLVSIFATLSAVAFLSNLLWENLQAPLFFGYVDFARHFPVCTLASAGDAALTAVFYLLIALKRRNPAWLWKKFRVSELTLAAASGVLAAILVEKLALAYGWWAYSPAMPLLPLLSVGLLPVLQLAVLPAANFVLARFVLVKFLGAPAKNGF